jgi:brefeldin A-resistance guanine nucleotide exchange factor 1
MSYLGFSSLLQVYSTKEDNDQLSNQFSIVLNEELKYHDSKSLVKCCETLAFLVRDAAHVTPHNFESCVHAIRVFVEASINGGGHLKHLHNKSAAAANEQPSGRKGRKLKKEQENKMKKSKSSPSHLQHVHESDDERDNDDYHSISIQLLDLMHTLHTRAASIFSSWAEEEKSRSADDGNEGFYIDTEQQEGVKITAEASTLWIKCWCPLLQGMLLHNYSQSIKLICSSLTGIARLCCDARRNVRSQALTYLQRALLVHDLQTLSATEWENCFNKVRYYIISGYLPL